MCFFPRAHCFASTTQRDYSEAGVPLRISSTPQCAYAHLPPECILRIAAAPFLQVMRAPLDALLNASTVPRCSVDILLCILQPPIKRTVPSLHIMVASITRRRCSLVLHTAPSWHDMGDTAQHPPCHTLRLRLLADQRNPGLQGCKQKPRRMPAVS